MFVKTILERICGIARDLAANGCEAFHRVLAQAGIEHVYYESPGTAHEWLTW